MKRTITVLLTGLVMVSTSCKKYLDINTNANQATSATPELVLPLALTVTAGDMSGYNTYGSQLGGYSANAGGYGGFGEAISYAFSSGTFTGLWSGNYNNLEDYQYIITQTDGQAPTYNNFNAAAKIMTALNFELLVDAYNDIPYSEALKGKDNLTPKYDKAEDIYPALANLLDSAIKRIDDASSAAGVKPLGTSDVLFAGDMTKWKKLANTLKLKLIITANGKATFANKTFSADGFLTADALVDPGYTRDNGKQNPDWNGWAFSYTGGDANKAWIPTQYVLGFYDGTKLSDSYRGKASYYQFPSTGYNRLGVENVSTPKCPSGSFWYSGTNRAGSSAGGAVGILKGPGAGYPLMLAAESYFLQAEGALTGVISGDPKTFFNAGIKASFTYLYTNEGGTIVGDPAGDFAKYQADNATDHLVNYDLGLTTADKLESIITQKYIADNYIRGEVSWNDYRRTGYPKVTPGGNGYQTFASTVSESPRPDKLPTRIAYPTFEVTLNPAHVETASPFTSFIFWAKQ